MDVLTVYYKTLRFMNLFQSSMISDTVPYTSTVLFVEVLFIITLMFSSHRWKLKTKPKPMSKRSWSTRLMN